MLLGLIQEAILVMSIAKGTFSNGISATAILINHEPRNYCMGSREDKTSLIGLIEHAVVFGKNGKRRTLIARIDTGATKCSIDVKIASQLELGPVIDTKLVRSSNGATLRPIVRAYIKIKNQEFKVAFTLADRKEMRYPLLIGQNLLKKSNFLIDPRRK